MKQQVTVFDNEVTEACDDVVEAHKAHKDAVDRLDCTKKHLAGLMKKHGLGDKQFIRHNYNGVDKIIILKEGKITEDTVGIRDAKDTD